MARVKKAKRRKKKHRIGIDLVGTAILKNLALTDLPMTEIARKLGVSPKVVGNVNKKYVVRSRELKSEIMGKAASVWIKAYRKKLLGPKVNFFTAKQKHALLKQYKGAIISVAKKWWAYEPLRIEFQDMKNFLEAINQYVFEKLDYYNPNVKGKKGRTASPITWMFRGARIYCLYLYSKITREKKGKTMPLGYDGLSLAQTGKVIKVKGIARKSIKEVQWIPFSAETLLRVLGLDPSNVAKLGYRHIKQQIVKIAKAKETGLNPRELEVIKLTLIGQTHARLAKKFGKTASDMSYVKNRAAQKIKKQLELKAQKK